MWSSHIEVIQSHTYSLSKAIPLHLKWKGLNLSQTFQLIQGYLTQSPSITFLTLEMSTSLMMFLHQTHLSAHLFNNSHNP